jgi:DNA integrity scanning protein DisA with diadenylate cyclase activity
MLNKFPVFRRFQVEEIFKDLDSKEKKFIEDYGQYRKARGLVSEDKLADCRRRA